MNTDSLEVFLSFSDFGVITGLRDKSTPSQLDHNKHENYFFLKYLATKSVLVAHCRK